MVVLCSRRLFFEWSGWEGEGSLKGRGKVQHAVRGILHLQASKRLENTQGWVYQTAQKIIYKQDHHQNASSCLQSIKPHNHFVRLQIRTDASKSRNDFLGIKGSRQAGEQNPSSPSSLPSGVVWAWPSLHFRASNRVLLHTTLGGSVPHLLAASLHPLAEILTSRVRGSKGVRLVGTKVLDVSVSGAILRVVCLAGPF
jgi:hypothetical protein